MPLRVADPLQPDSLAGLFGPEVGVIINCVGPFTRFGEPVVKAAIMAGVPYLDITGEQGYLARIISLYDEAARQNGTVVVPACGVEYALTNWAATLAAEGLEPLEEIWTATAVQAVRASRGTQLSLFEALGQPGISWQDGKRAYKVAGSSRRLVDFPAPFGSRWAVWTPFGETVTLPRYLPVKNVNSYLAVGGLVATALGLFSPLLPVLSKIGGALVKPMARSPKPETAEKSRWAVMAEARSATRRQTVTLEGRNVYQLTANITTWAAMQMLEPGFKTKAGGILGPAQAFDSRAALDYLGQFGVSYRITSES